MRSWTTLAGWASVVLLDQLSKAWIVSVQQVGTLTGIGSGSVDRPVPGDVLRLSLAYNPGTAFRWLLPFLSPTFGYGVLYALACFFLIRYALARPVAVVWWAVILVLGGASGNFFDRIRIGRVVDFVSLGLPGFEGRLPTFNLADVAICTGAGMLVWWEWRGIPRPNGRYMQKAPATGSHGVRNK